MVPKIRGGIKHVKIDLLAIYTISILAYQFSHLSSSHTLETSSLFSKFLHLFNQLIICYWLMINNSIQIKLLYRHLLLPTFTIYFFSRHFHLPQSSFSFMSCSILLLILWSIEIFLTFVQARFLSNFSSFLSNFFDQILIC